MKIRSSGVLGSLVICTLALPSCADNAIKPVATALNSSANLEMAGKANPAGTAWMRNRPAYDVNLPPHPVLYTEAQKATQLEAGIAMLKAVNAAARALGVHSYTVAPGIYRFPKEGPDSNFSWSGVRDFTLNLKGVEIILPGGGRVFDLKDTHNLTITGPVNFDADPLPVIQAIVTDYDAATGTAKLKVMPGYSTDIPEKTQIDVYSPSGVYLENPSWAGYKEGKVLDDGARLVQLNVGANNPLYKMGNLVTIGVRGSQLLEADNVDGLTLRDFNLYEGGGFMHGGTSGEVKFINLRGSRRPGTNRLYAVTGAQAWNSGGTVTFDGCELGGGADDIMDWTSGGIFTVYKQEGPRTLISYAWPFHDGNKVVFYDKDDLNPLGEATVLTVTDIDDPAMKAEVQKVVKEVQRTSYRDNMVMQRLTFDRDIKVPSGAFIENSSGKTAVFTVRNSYFHDCGVRLMVQGFDKGLFENNVVERVSGGLDLTTDAWWHEGAPVQNVIVRGNTFIQSAYRNAWGTGKAAIKVAPSWTAGSGKRNPDRKYASSNIVITGNTIKNASTAAILVSNGRDVTIEGNAIDSAFTLANPIGAIQLDTVANARIQNNTVKNTPGQNLVLSRVDGATVQGNHFEDANLRVGNPAHSPSSGVISVLDSAKVQVEGNSVAGSDTPYAIWVAESPDTRVGANTAKNLTLGGAKLLGTDTDVNTYATEPDVPVRVALGGGAAAPFLGEAQVHNLAIDGGNSYRAEVKVNLDKVANPAPAAVYQTERWGKALKFTFSQMKPGGRYLVRLHFAENSFWDAAGKRVFGVSINDKPVLSNFDVFAAGGGGGIAIIKEFAASADATGKIVISAKASVDNASIHAIEILPSN